MTTLEFSNQLTGLQEILNRFAMKLTSDKHDAKDLTQETFLRALSYHDQFEDSTNLKAWTYTIMKNTFINNYRKRVRQNTFLDRSVDLFYLSQNKDTSDVTPDSAVGEKEILGAVERLQGEYRVPFKMYTQGYKYKEIADILGLKIGTVKSRIFFTRKKLARILQGYN